jgi:hypothetical protein
MPFDSVPAASYRKRLVALDDTLLKFATAAQEVSNVSTRPIPHWHSNRHAERMGGTLKVLVRARALIADERHWCRGSYARSWRGIPVLARSVIAQRFCALGAVMRAARELGLPSDGASLRSNGRPAAPYRTGMTTQRARIPRSWLPSMLRSLLLRRLSRVRCDIA